MPVPHPWVGKLELRGIAVHRPSLSILHHQQIQVDYPRRVAEGPPPPQRRLDPQ